MTSGRVTSALAIVIVLGAWTGLARALVGAPLYAAVLDVALLVLAIVVLARVVQRRERPRVTVLTALIAVYLVIALIEMFNPNVPSLRAGLEGYRKTAFTMLGFFVVAYAGEIDPGRFFRIVAVGMVPAFLWSARQFAAPLGAELDIITTSGISPITFHAGQVMRAFAPTAGPFHLGILGAAVVVIAILLATSRRPAWLIVAAVAGLTLGLSLTRADLIGAVMAGVVIVVTAAPMRERLRTAGFAAVPLAIAGAAALVAVGALPTRVPPGQPQPSGPPGTTIDEIISMVEDPLADQNLQFRFTFWREFAAAVAERPVIGYGTGAAADGFDRFYAATGSRNFEPHSLYLKAALEFGVAGLVLFLAILAGVALTIRHAWAVDPVTARTVLGLLVLVVVAGITGPMLDAYPFNLLFWASCGWVAVAARRAVGSEPIRPAVQPSVA